MGRKKGSKNRPKRSMALARTLADVIPGEFRPSPGQIDFLADRIREPHMPLHVTAERVKAVAEEVYAWFQNPAFIEWFRAGWENSAECWTQEMWDIVRRDALTGNWRALKFWLTTFDRRVAAQAEKAAQAAKPDVAVAVQVSIDYHPPADPEVRAREGVIINADVVEVSKDSEAVEATKEEGKDAESPPV